MNNFELMTQVPTTPAFILDQQQFQLNLQRLSVFKQQSGCKLLYSIKALPLMKLLDATLDIVDGFSVSSLFEARLANEVLAGRGSIHLTTPGIREDQIAELANLCSHISGNSLSQCQLFAENIMLGECSFGLRINPHLSFASDLRFDPCRPYSKLGVDIQGLQASDMPINIEGLHVHTVFSALDVEPLLKTVEVLLTQAEAILPRLKWLNLGGGYLFDRITDLTPVVELVKRIQSRYDLQVFIEPGKAVVGSAGYLVSSVVDCFISDDKALAVLDTSVNHYSEVFEYQREPALMGHLERGVFPVMLVGSSCLAGDIFGEYRFNQPLQRKDRVVFNDVGAYTLIKANRFNGYPLPDIYWLNAGELTLVKRDSYLDYRRQWTE